MMVNISSIYPVKEGYIFDFDYYLNNHMPKSIALLSRANGYRGVSVERGIGIENLNINSSYAAMCHYYFDTFEDFLKAFTPNADWLQGDVKNYTNIQPLIQINEVEISAPPCP